MIMKLFKLIKKVQSEIQEDQIFIYYMFYNEDNPLLSRNIKHKLIYDENDIFLGLKRTPI